MDKTTIIIIGIGVLMVVLWIASSVKAAARRRIEKEHYQKMSARATGTITKRNVTKELREKRSDEDKDEYDYVCYVSYTFVANGQTYSGYGEGSRAHKHKNEQTICYDPTDPNSNCTEYFYKKKTQHSIVGDIIAFIVFAGAVAFAYCYAKGIIKF